MFNNKLTILINSDRNKLLRKEVCWQDQCRFLELMNKYVPEHCSEIIPIDDLNYSIYWKSRAAYESFMSEKDLALTLDILAKYDIYISFVDS